MATQASGERQAYEEFLINREKLASTEGARICSYHPAMVGRYFSITLGIRKDLYGQSEGESCSGMLPGCVEHLVQVCGGDIMKENTCFFGEHTNA